jgi:hypothetical protein
MDAYTMCDNVYHMVFHQGPYSKYISNWKKVSCFYFFFKVRIVDRFTEVKNTHTVAVCLFRDETDPKLQGTNFRGRNEHRNYCTGT